MKYPLQYLTILLPNGPQSLLVPDINTVKKTHKSSKRGDFPYWAAVWPAAIALSIYLQQNPDTIRGKKVLELAAGLGLPSLVAAPFAQTVYCTDIDADAMDIATHSASLNGLTNMHFACINWNNIPAEIKVDTLLLSDVNYAPEAFPTLWKLIHRFLQQGTTILLATPQRLMAKPFIEQLLPYCTRQQTISAGLPGETPADISVLVLAGSS